MNTQRTVFISLLVLLFLTLTAHAQVTIDSSTTYSDAMKALEKLSSKLIVDPYKYNSPIGVTVFNKPWREAFEMILKSNGLWYVEEQNYFLITVSGQAPAVGKSSETKKDSVIVSSLSRDVRISAVFFSLNTQKSMELGIDWRVPFKFAGAVTGTDDSAVVAFGSSPPPSPSALTSSTTGAFNAAYSGHFDFGNVSALARFLSQNSLGEVIASPQITVHTGEKGVTNIGTSVPYVRGTSQTAGVATQEVDYLQTGIILDINPIVVTEGNFSFIYLTVRTENSTPGTAVSGFAPRIDKQSTTTRLLLADGEETIISGLYTNTESKIRSGIPILKDLPWWFLGLRYVFGTDVQSTIRTELVILLKAEMLPTVRERAKMKVMDSLLEQGRQRFQDELDKFKTKDKEN